MSVDTPLAAKRLGNGRSVGADECQVREVLDRVGDKWSVIVIYLLGLRTHRFTDLLRAIDGISSGC
jgi:DNA-binding HxlR family transcriptional regulator